MPEHLLSRNMLSKQPFCTQLMYLSSWLSASTTFSPPLSFNTCCMVLQATPNPENCLRIKTQMAQSSDHLSEDRFPPVETFCLVRKSTKSSKRDIFYLQNNLLEYIIPEHVSSLRKLRKFCLCIFARCLFTTASCLLISSWREE